ncbi:MAG: MBOAT family protein [Tardiphaga sp.]|nr:MBOAT family protein [Tardiphaga sp.]
MQFNSPIFLFVFLPVTFAGFFLLGHFRAFFAAALWAAIASLVFYSWDTWRLLPLILSSIIFNYIVGRLLADRQSRAILWTGIGMNLAGLAYFKYGNFIGENLVHLGFASPIEDIVLPIGISFFTFTQIAFLVDASRGEAKEYRFVHYVLFVTYFPHLIAGPILHHKDIMPQFAEARIYGFNIATFALGLGWFAAGIFKKVVLADSIAPFADAAFNAAAKGEVVTSADAWLGAISYTLQLYYDFAGYSDMAIGLALMMGIAVPLNFYSPYKATSLIEFWRRWHMTLSRFLRDYLYIPLGGSRNGTIRRYVNLALTMVLGGLWHGASWNFVLWGAIHGVGLIVNHAWRYAAKKYGVNLPVGCGFFLTIVLIILAWVPFRASSFEAAHIMWSAMLVPHFGETAFRVGWVWAAVLTLIAVLLPNTAQIFDRSAPARWFSWRPNLAWAIVSGCAVGLSVALSITMPSSFLYFRF